MKSFFEEMMFAPKIYHYPFLVLFFPLSILYGTIMFIRRVLSKKIDFEIPIISVGNLVVGGSGKTPFVIDISSHFDNVAVVSRGYGRKSKGLVEVSRNGELLVDVNQSGDEPMLMAKSLPKSSVIVSEDRHKAIKLAKKNGAKIIVLDDGFNRVEIKKFELLLEPKKILNKLPFPSGAFREFSFSKMFADRVLKEGVSFERVVSFENLTERMLLVTAISRPERLDEYLPKGVVAKIYFEDHAYFEKDYIEELVKKNRATSLLCTSKDMVKLDSLDINLSEMKLSLLLNNDIIDDIKRYIDNEG